MKTVLVISFSNLRSDPRVYRQIKYLALHYRVIAAGLASPDIEGVEFIPIGRTEKGMVGKLLSGLQLLVGAYDQFYWRQGYVIDAAARLSNVSADLILANEIETLPLALKLGPRVLFDAHEYSPEEFDSLWFRLFFKRLRIHLEKTYIPRCREMFTVCQSIAERYRQDTGVAPRVMINAPKYVDLRPSPVGTPIRLVHHGSAVPERRLETMIEVMKHLDSGFELNFVLVDQPNGYLKRLQSMASPYPTIKFLAPVAMQELSSFLNQFDVGIYLLDPTNYNNRVALPNKFFEFIQARLAVAIGPSPEMSRLVKEFGFGVISDDFSPRSMAQALRRLDPLEIGRLKERSHQAARELSAESTAQILLDSVRRALESEVS